MDRVCLLKSTGKLIEMQGGGLSDNLALNAERLETLVVNAINAGYKKEDIEAKWVNAEELAAIIEADKLLSPAPTKEEAEAKAIEALITEKTREQAVAALIAEGKLTAEGKLATETKI